MARANVAAFTPETLDLRRFKSSPFVARTLRTAPYVYVRDDRLGKPSLAPKYTGPYRVISRNWDNNTFMLDIGKRQDAVSLAQLKASVLPEESVLPQCWGGRILHRKMHGVSTGDLREDERKKVTRFVI